MKLDIEAILTDAVNAKSYTYVSGKVFDEMLNNVILLCGEVKMLRTQFSALDESLHSGCTLTEDHPTVVQLRAVTNQLIEITNERNRYMTALKMSEHVNAALKVP